MAGTDLVKTIAGLPAGLADVFGVTKNDDLVKGVSAAIKLISTRGSKWRVVSGGTESLVKIPGTDDAAPALEVVLLKANPQISKLYYATAYVEGSDAKPDCFSNDGERPDPSAAEPQSKICAACPHNVWGSKITPQGKKSKACADNRRVAVAPAGDLSQPMLLRVPAASLGDLAKYGEELSGHGVSYRAVVTRLAFDPDAAFPKITFRRWRDLSQEELVEVAQLLQSGAVDHLVSTSVAETTEADAEHVEAETKAEEPAKPRRGRPPRTAAEPVQDAPKAEEKAAKPAEEPVFSEEQRRKLDDVLASLD